MKTLKNSKSVQTSKGVRLHWQSLKDVKPVKLSNMTAGKFVSEKELNSRSNYSELINVIVP
jgi:hypothetical protein